MIYHRGMDKRRVSTVDPQLWLKAHDLEKYNMLVDDGTRHTLQWDEPKLILKL